MNAATHRFWSGIADALRAGQPVFLALVADASEHSPGSTGARLSVTADGRREGTIGGGVMELRVVERARELLANPERRVEKVELHHCREPEDGAERSGMICAGRQTNLYCLLTPEPDLATADALVGHLRQDRPARLVVDSRRGLAVEEGAAEPGSRFAASSDGWRYEASTQTQKRLAILGGGHCGQALARLVAGLGWQVDVWETRPAVIDAAQLDQHATVHQVDDFRDAAAQIQAPASTPVVVMTTDVPNDVRALTGVLSLAEAPFVGVMGSQAKLDEIRRRLHEAGFTDAQLDRLTAPVGLPIASRTPAEIAVSVAAQLLEKRHRWLS